MRVEKGSVWTPGEAKQLECTRGAINLSLKTPQKSPRGSPETLLRDPGGSLETPRETPEAAQRSPRDTLENRGERGHHARQSCRLESCTRWAINLPLLETPQKGPRGNPWGHTRGAWTPRKAEVEWCTRWGVDLSACPRRHFLPVRTLSDRIYPPEPASAVNGRTMAALYPTLSTRNPGAQAENTCGSQQECLHQPLSRVKPCCRQESSCYVYKWHASAKQLGPTKIVQTRSQIRIRSAGINLQLAYDGFALSSAQYAQYAHNHKTLPCTISFSWKWTRLWSNGSLFVYLNWAQIILILWIWILFALNEKLKSKLAFYFSGRKISFPRASALWWTLASGC